MKRFCWLALLLFWANAGLADEIRPGYLSISEGDSFEYRAVQKLPMKGDRVLGLYPQYPTDCGTELLHHFQDGRAATFYWLIRCEQSLQGREVAIPALVTSRTDVYLRYQTKEREYHHRLTPEQPAQQLAQASGSVWSTYILLGTEHILVGWDHLCFVLLLVFVTSSLRQLLYAVTGFTLAHSLTLAASTLGWVSPPGTTIEILIATSIVFLARELLVARRSGSLTTRHPVLITTLFGLLHGFGFASVLLDIGFPRQQIGQALLSFNIGVELGQLLFIAVIIVGMKLAAPLIRQRQLITSLSLIAGIIGSYWGLERSLILFQQFA